MHFNSFTTCASLRYLVVVPLFGITHFTTQAFRYQIWKESSHEHLGGERLVNIGEGPTQNDNQNLTTGWALLCRNSRGCKQFDIDALDNTRTKIAMVLGPKDQGTWLVRVAKGWPDDGELRAEPVLKKKIVPARRLVMIEQLKVWNRTVGYRYPPSETLPIKKIFPIPEQAEREQDLYGYFMSMVWTPQATMSAQEEMALQFQLQASYDVKALQKDRKETINARREQARMQLQLATSKKANLLAEIAGGIRRTVMQRKVQPICAGASSSGRHLNEQQSKHNASIVFKTRQALLLQSIATQIQAFIFGGLQAAADAGLPGIGVVLKTGGWLATEATKLASDLGSRGSKAISEISRGFVRLGQEADEVDVQENFGSKVSTAMKGGAKNSTTEALKESAAKRARDLNNIIREADKLVRSALKGAALEGVWTAAEFIPIVGPFMGMARDLLGLAILSKLSFQEWNDYFAKKDRMTRSLFRVRDCALAALVRSEAISAVSLNLQRGDLVSVTARATALMTVLEGIMDALDINSGLLKDMKKKTRIHSRAADHEAWVMKRLQTGSTRVANMVSLYGTVPENAAAGDPYLSPDSLAPSAWEAQFGEIIRTSWAEIESSTHMQKSRHDSSRLDSRQASRPASRRESRY